MARRSSWEAAAALDMLRTSVFLTDVVRARAEATLDEISAVLTSLIR